MISTTEKEETKESGKMPTIAELEEQLKQARAEEARIAEAARVAKAKQEKQGEIDKVNGYAEHLRAELVAAGVACAVKPARIGQYGDIHLPSLEIADSGLRVEMDRRGGGYGSERSYQITVGSYGDRKTYPLLKSGTFNFPKIVEDVKQRVQREQMQAKYSKDREAKRAASMEIVTRLRTELEIPEHRVIGPCDTDAEKVRVQLDLYISEDQAREVLSAATHAGIKL